MIKKILIGLGILLSITVLGSIIFLNTGTSLPEETDEIIKEVMASNDIPKQVTGETGFAKSNGVNIWYEKISPLDTPKATILLVMGHSATALIWTPRFYQAFVDAGYQVIRYDNRGTGESDWIKDWTVETTYTLEDMAKDGMAVLDAAGIEKAHIIGASMGGMIGQRMAISHSDRLLSFTSIMSSGYMNDPNVPEVPRQIITDFARFQIKYGITKSEENQVKMAVGIQHLLKGNGDYKNDVKKAVQRTLYELRERKGFNPIVGDQHTAAINASGSRLEELKNIKAPTLVIHGKSDPLVIFPHAEVYAPLIPNADTLYIDGMGHDLPNIYMKEIHAAIFKNFEKVNNQTL